MMAKVENLIATSKRVAQWMFDGLTALPEDPPPHVTDFCPLRKSDMQRLANELLDAANAAEPKGEG